MAQMRDIYDRSLRGGRLKRAGEEFCAGRLLDILAPGRGLVLSISVPSLLPVRAARAVA